MSIASIESRVLQLRCDQRDCGGHTPTAPSQDEAMRYAREMGWQVAGYSAPPRVGDVIGQELVRDYCPKHRSDR